jgi:hypothetical protein
MFGLWHPVVHADLGGCSFDVVRMEDRELGEGTPLFVTNLLRDLRVDAHVKSWRFTPFCTGFYGDPHGEHWMDRYPMAWRVDVRFRTRYWSSTFVFRYAGAATNEVDPTAPRPDYDDPDYFLFHERPAVVVAVFPDVEREDLVASSGWRATFAGAAVELSDLSPDLVQARLALGVVRFPDDEPRLTAAVDALRTIGGRVHWTDLAPYTED